MSLIRTELIVDFSQTDKTFVQVSAFPETLKRVATRAFNQRIRLGLLSQLRKTPKRRPWTRGDFVSDKQRRAFFAKTHGQPYQRTGRLVAGWRTDLIVNDEAIAFTISNPASAEKYVQGKFQQPGHAKTGWGKHEDVFKDWTPRVFAAVTDAMIVEIERQLS